MVFNANDKLKQDDDFKCQACASEETDTVEEFQSVEINSQSLKIVEFNQSLEVV